MACARKIKPHIHAIYPLKETQKKPWEEMMQRKVRGKMIECSYLAVQLCFYDGRMLAIGFACHFFGGLHP